MRDAATPKAILIDVASIETRPKNGPGVCIDSFLYKFFEPIKFLTMLLYFVLK